MKIKLLKTTWPHLQGDTATVKRAVGERWVKNKIAVEVVRDGRKAVKADTKGQEIKKEPEKEKEVVPLGALLDYSTMTKNELVGELWQRGIEHNKRQNKAELIALLEGE